MNLNTDQAPRVVSKPEPFVLEKNSAVQIKLVLLSVVVVAVVWVGVLITLGVEVIRRMHG